MNAVEIEVAVSKLAGEPFDAAEFSFAFLAAFGNKETTIKRLGKGESNASDVPGAVLQRNNIHMAVCEVGRVDETLKALRESPMINKIYIELLKDKAAVTVAIVGIGPPTTAPRRLYVHDEHNGVVVREGSSITPYLTLGPRIIVQKRDAPISAVGIMEFGNKPSDGGNLLLWSEEQPTLGLDIAQRDKFIRRIYGSDDFINGGSRLCIWIEDRHLNEAQTIASLKTRIEAV